MPSIQPPGKFPAAHWLIAGLLLAPATPVSTIADVPPPGNPRLARPVLERITTFMRGHDFAPPYLAREIVEESASASIPPSLIVCIEFYESSGGKYYDAQTNNPLGWKSGKASFPSVRDAIAHVSAELGSGYYYAGKTIEQKLWMYNPRPAYAVKILDCMREIDQPASALLMRE